MGYIHTHIWAISAPLTFATLSADQPSRLPRIQRSGMQRACGGMSKL